jgi:hypothetical protein
MFWSNSTSNPGRSALSVTSGGYRSGMQTLSRPSLSTSYRELSGGKKLTANSSAKHNASGIMSNSQCRLRGLAGAGADIRLS